MKHIRKRARKHQDAPYRNGQGSSLPGDLECLQGDSGVSTAWLWWLLILAVALLPASCAAATAWSTTDCGHATVGTLYGCTVAAVNGTPPYTYALVSGSLGPYTLNGSTGVIAGTAPAGKGQYLDFVLSACDSLLSCTNREFFIMVSPSLGTHWGLAAQTAAGCTPNGYFQLVKSGNRWQFCDADGHPFWMIGVDNATPSFQATTCLNGVGNCGLGRYPGGASYPYFYQRVAGPAASGPNAAGQLKDWGFNAVGEFSLLYFYDGATASNIPFFTQARPIELAQSGGCPAPYSGVTIKNIYGPSLTYLPITLTGVVYPVFAGDVFDQMWVPCENQAVATMFSNVSGLPTNPFLIGYVPDESDSMQSLSAQLTVCGNPPCANAQLGYLIAVANYCPGTSTGSQTSAATSCSTGANGQYPMWSKYAWTCGIPGIDFGWGSGVSYLQSVYGSIAATNASWGTSYTTFCDSTGSTSGAWLNNLSGPGTGLLNENGVLTVGIGGLSDPFGLTALNGTSTQQAHIQADLNAFYRAYAKRMFAGTVAAIRASDTNHIVFSMDKLCAADPNGHQWAVAPSSFQLNGMLDAGIQQFIGAYSESTAVNVSPAAAFACLKYIYDTTGKTAFPWFAQTANADSFWSTHSCPGGSSDNYATQALRATNGYVPVLNAMFNATCTDGSYCVPGVKMWGFTDDNGSGNIAPAGNGCAPNNAVGGGVESLNLGLISNNGNPYDGNSAIAAAGVDHFGYVTGGETGNYGNFLGPVTQANSSIQQSFFPAGGQVGQAPNITAPGGVQGLMGH